MASTETVVVLAALVDASLIQTEIVAGGIVRFSMLELIRDYALQRLQAAGAEEICQRWHAAYFARLAETVIAHFGPEQGVRDAQFVLAQTQELPNARAALEWAEEMQEAELGLRLTGFTRLWHIRGQMSEAERWLERMLALDLWSREQGMHVAPLTLRIEKLYGLGRTLVRHGKGGRGAENFAKEALHLARQIHDHNSISNAYATLGMIAQASGKLDDAEDAFTASYTHARQTGQSGLMSRALVGLAELAGMRGNVASAITLLEDALANAKTTGMTWDIPVIMTLFGHMVSQQQNYALVKAHYRKALILYRTFSSPTYIASCLEGYAAVACAEGHSAQATRLCAAAAILREQTQTELLPAEREAFEQIVVRARATLDERVFGEEWATGIRLTHNQAIDYALSDAST